jgi:O-methyltransferase
VAVRPLRRTSLKNSLKQSRTLHSTYKFARLIREAPLSHWAHLQRTVAIFRVLPNTMVSAPRLMNAYDAVTTVEREEIDGAVVECGVWAGGAIGLMASASKRFDNKDRIFHLFDSFEGLPQPSELDADVIDDFKTKHPDVALDDGDGESGLVAIGACAAPLDEVNRLFFDVLDIDPRQVVIHEGWFQDTVPAAAPSIGPIAVLRLDGDWYESTKTCLEGLYDNVVPNGFVLIDDYGMFVGCSRAVDEFIAGRGLSIELIDIDGVGVFFRKPAD